MHSINIKIPIFDFRLNVRIAEYIDAVIKQYMRKFKMEAPEEDDEFHGLAVHAPNQKFYIFYQLHSLTPNYIVHEVSHIVDYIIEKTEVEKLGETRAYLTGYIAEKIFDYVLKHKLLISKHLEFVQKPAPMAE